MIWVDAFYMAPLLWGVGNGWAAAGMTRVIRALPDSMRSDRDRIAGYVRELLDACLKFQRTDGLFHDVLDDPSTFVETNAAQMFVYALEGQAFFLLMEAAYRDYRA
jgi:unsaturated rhamnogalacturonyl hydrolase